MSSEELLQSLDGIVETEQDLGRYLGQIQPLGEDLARTLSEGVRIMTMNGAKGLTVRATIIGALEDGIIPRPDCDLGEERRLLYVAMTRAGSPKVGALRQHSSFLDGGPVESQDGASHLRRHWS